MTAEQQLERSVLEGKERDELSAIAQAMSLKTTSRTKKADIIDQILDATGVTSGSAAAGSSNGDAGHTVANGAKPTRRSRSATTAATETGDEADGTAMAATSDPGGEADATTAAATAGGDPAPISAATGEAAGPGNSGPAVFVEPPELADPGDTAPRQNGQNNQGHNQQGNRNRQNQNSQNHNQPDGDVGNRRSRRRRGRERGGQGGELQGGGQEQPYSGELVEVKGMLDLRDEGYGFLRCEGYLASPKDVYVSISQARRFALRRGDYVEGACRPASNNEKYPALLRIDSISGLDPEEARNRPRFEDLTPLFPDSRLHLEMQDHGDKDNLTARIVDLLSPIGKGQRGLIVSPPKAGKTTVMKQIAHSIEANNPEVHLMVLLVDERPEEVTDMRRSVRGEVIASTFDRPADEHTQVAELTIERAKRLVEMGRDVVIVLDGITRLARAYNLAA